MFAIDSLPPFTMGRMKSTLTLSLCACLMLLSACGDDKDEGSDVDCSAADVPTYETFGKAFVEDYCASCHAGTVTGAARNGAPVGDTFDTLAEIQAKSDQLHEEVTIEKAMPFGAASKKPSAEERELFGTWMECGAK